MRFFVTTIFTFALCIGSFSQYALAQQRTPTTPAGINTPTTPAGINTPPTPAPTGVVLENPLDSSISSIPAFFQTIVDILLIFAVPFIVFFIIYAGFLYVTARGNAEKIATAHRALLYALIGGLLILGAQVLLSVIGGTVAEITG